MSLARDVTTVGSATLLSRLLGFFRDVGIAAVLGAGALSDAYFVALQIPNLFRRLLAEGALNSAFVPMWMRIRDESGGARRFGEEVLGTILVALAAFAVLCVVFAPTVVALIAPGFGVEDARFADAVEFVRLSAPYVAVAALVAVSSSILNAEARVAAAAFGLVAFNGVMLVAVIAVVFLGPSRRAGDILSVAVVLAGLAQLLLVGTALWRLPQRPRRPIVSASANLRRFFAKAVPGVLAGGVPQLKLIVGTMVASSSPSAVSWLYYANRLYELPLGVASVAIASALAPRIAASVRDGERAEIAAAQSRALEIALGLALPAAVAFAALSEPIAGALFERGAFGRQETAAVAAALTAISAGLPGHVLEKVLGAVSFAHQDTRTPMGAALAGLAVAAAMAVLLFPRYGHVGVAAAIAVSGWIGATLLAIVLLRRGWLAIDAAAWRRLSRIAAATGVMGAGILAGDELLAVMFDVTSTSPRRIAALATLVVGGLGIYLLALQRLGIGRLREMIAAVRQRI